VGEPRYALECWVIYDHPRDIPWAFVLRRWVGETPDQTALAVPTLEDARALVPGGLVRIDRFPADDPAIVEVWL
jgi:hypothetical protein